MQESGRSMDDFLTVENGPKESARQQASSDEETRNNRTPIIEEPRER